MSESRLYDPELWEEVEDYLQLASEIDTIPDQIPEDEAESRHDFVRRQVELDIGPPVVGTYGEYTELAVPDWKAVIPLADRREKASSGFEKDSADDDLNLGRYKVMTKPQEQLMARIIEKGRRARYFLEEGYDNEEFWAAYRQGSQAKGHFLRANLRLVGSIAVTFPTRSVMTKTDLIQEGTLGLEHAIDKFEWRRDLKFSTYATWWIRQAIGRAVNQKASLIRIPSGPLQELRRFMKRSDFDPDKLPPDLRQVFSMSNPASMSAELSSDGDLTLEDVAFIAPDDTEADFLATLQHEEIEELFDGTLGLSPYETELLRKKYFVGEPSEIVEGDHTTTIRKERSNEELGEYYGLTGAGIRNHINSAMETIKCSLALKPHIRRCNLSDEEAQLILTTLMMRFKRGKFNKGEQERQQLLGIFELVYGEERINKAISVVTDKRAEIKWLKNTFSPTSERFSISNRQAGRLGVGVPRAKELHTELLLELGRFAR